MIRKLCLFFLLGIGFFARAQTVSKDFRIQKIEVTKDTIRFDSVSIHPKQFKVFNAFGKRIPSEAYKVNFKAPFLIIDAKKYAEITIEYFRFPDFLTKVYTPFDKKLIVPNTTNTGKLYSLTTNKKTTDIALLDGLQTKGFIARGITAGNNQNAVTNAGLDLEISGKLSKDVTLRANIFDTNIPLQENGYSQNITDFDRIFIELFSEKWRVKAGDISLQNNETYFMPFNKQVSGLEVEAAIGKHGNASASGAIVRGKFFTLYFTGLEGNQGPYKLRGPNNEPGIIIIAGSETVYVNGVAIEGGKEKDYTIDYNLAEITFNTTFPITNDMRIAVDFQFSDRNYTRFITYEKASYKKESFSISGYFYNESDAKNQPLQQNLTESQKQVLAAAGNDTSKMITENAFVDTFSENKILYQKTMMGSLEVFEYSTDESLELYNVTFSNVGPNKGNYAFDRSIAIGNVFKFVGVNLGDYNPVTQLIAPTRYQTAVVKSSYQPNHKTTLQAEFALSNNDQNLFSSIDDNANKGVATFIRWQQLLVDKKWQLKTKVDFEFKHANFFTEQQTFEPVEFNRDWNLLTNIGDKSLLQTQFILENKDKGRISYQFHQLNYAGNFKGVKHFLNTKIKANKTVFSLNSSFLSNTNTLEKGSFLRVKGNVEQSFSKNWLGAFVNFETNERKNKTTDEFVNTSHRFKEYETYLGIGDSTKVYAKFGFNYRNNDSIRSHQFQEINNRKTWYVQSKLIQNKTTDVSIYANYRITENSFAENEKALNSKLIYRQRFFNNFFTLGNTYETSSGNVAQQDYVYVKTEPGFGFYTWIDYNNNGVEEFNEFEVAQFQDQANYLRVPLPNLRFIATQRVKWQQSIIINPLQWSNTTGLKKAFSHIYNQTVFSIDNEQARQGDSFNLNPFQFHESSLVGLQLNFRNQLYWNRNLQKNSIVYTYGFSQNKQQYFVGNQENKIVAHQLEYAHKITKFWLFDLFTKHAQNNLKTENFTNRNYEIQIQEIQPKISFVYSKNHRLSAFYHFKNKKNKLLDFEKLQQQQIGLDYFYRTKKHQQVSIAVTAFLNDFTGNTNTPVAYQMLEGLQAGANYTWSFLWQQKLNSFLHLNINYLGRKSENAKAIHTGSVQLKALF